MVKHICGQIGAEMEKFYRSTILIGLDITEERIGDAMSRTQHQIMSLQELSKKSRRYSYDELHSIIKGLEAVKGDIIENRARDAHRKLDTVSEQLFTIMLDKVIECECPNGQRATMRS